MSDNKRLFTWVAMVLGKFIKALSTKERYRTYCGAPVSRLLFKGAIITLDILIPEEGGYSAFIKNFIECKVDGLSTCNELGFDGLNEFTRKEAYALAESDIHRFLGFWERKRIPDSKVLAILASTVYSLTA